MVSRFPTEPKSFAWQYIKNNLVFMLVVFASNGIVIAIQQLLPWLISRVVDQVTSSQPPVVVWNGIFAYLGYVLLALCVSYIISAVAIITTEFKLTGDLCVKVGKDLFSSVLPHSRKFWQKNPAGAMFNKMNILRKRCSGNGGYVGIYFFFYRRTLEFLIVWGLLAHTYLPLGGLILFFLIVLSFVLYFISNNVSVASKQKADASSKTFGKMIDMCNNYFLIKVFGSKQREAEIFADDLNDLKEKSENYEKKHLKHTMIQQLLSMLFMIGFVCYSVFLWVQKIISAGDLVYIFSALTGLMMSFRIFGYVILELKACNGAMASAIPLFNEEYEIKDGTKNLRIEKGAIEFDNVFFSYDGKKDVIKGINLKIKPKEKVGIVGVSGGGKTTLIHLLQRTYDISSGVIKIDGQDIKNTKLKSLRKAIAFIPQDTILFHRSLKENAIYGTFNATKRKVEDAASKSHIDEFIEKLPSGYETIVGDKGVKLSGGQRQRVGISRALIKDAPILLLDEATSALDSKSEKYIQNAIQEIIQGKTVIAIAHRLSTLKDMDRIVIIDKGKVVEEGKPDELLKKKGKFAKLWKIQMNM